MKNKWTLFVAAALAFSFMGCSKKEEAADNSAPASNNSAPPGPSAGANPPTTNNAPSSVSTSPDQVLSRKVKNALISRQELGSSKIDVEASNGDVTLKGAVKSDADKALAEKLAKQTPGVKKVTDSLTVSK